MPDFSLKKWYLDAADAQGQVYIGYWASLSWGKLRLYGYHHFVCSPANGADNQGRFTRQPEPSWTDDEELAWRPEDLRAAWKCARSDVAEKITAKNGEINWHCLQPKARASINLRGISFTGWGYTEVMDITIPVWDLPFKTLYWGRCHSENHYLVWIKLDGQIPLNVIWHNGSRSDQLAIKENGIGGPDFELAVTERVPLRRGKLLSTVFKPFKEVTGLLPRNAFLANEEKWYGRGILTGWNNQEEAVIIYEKVTW